MRTLIPAACAAMALMVAAPPAAAAGSGLDEVVVTAQRISSVRGRSDDDQAAPQQPHVVVFHRADNLIVDLVVDCDTRDRSDRLTELKATLRSVIASAQADGAIELGIADEEAGVILPLKAEALDALLSNGARPDTTTATIVVKTHLTPADTFDTATGRIDAFIKRIKTVGRAQAARNGDWQLTIIGPRQYRADVITAIAKDANDAAKAFGPAYTVGVTGLERPVSWTRSGSLELALYIPYTLAIQALPGR
jgi:hypothetical protein